ncbi:hypothetical protein [Agrobacterium rosae]|uniref:Uncharacterized protein n=1 Tax=Agrobacterium rosae TaxID=1972867 RepID=A0A1R3TGR0_9HYPH|nr:hypothetical protein [Agrobacterium rosae]SCX16966.1 hypothetical protein DSM25559_1534 [Agrobacterium rosae]
MSEVEDTALKEMISRSEAVGRFVCFCLCLVLFNIGYSACLILSLPLPPPENTVSLFLALMKAAFFSKQTMVLFMIAIFYGRPFDRPSPPKGQYLDFPGWLLNHPYAGICLGVTLFISPLLIAIGLEGIAYLLAAVFVLYSTPRLLAQGLAGAALLLTAWTLAGFFVTSLIYSIPTVKTCEGGASVELRSVPAIPCEDFVFLDDVNGLVIRHQKTSVFVRIEDLAPSASKTLGMDSWFWHIRPID